MFWKILGVVALIWLAFVVLGILIKGLVWILVVSGLAFGGYLLYRAVTKNPGQPLIPK
ncbi:hypothetical protein [Speluncibacter jeojiensis]|uniref:Uncharacterized protein n=1 Tax=Speluncibacter jeojiensis TaxID=2710754 RepID=A0A9X4RGC8_9ACTN|nr:hypothetical protein [Rhodococcus sp. D2-41]MDG3013881.1 hypothetical protein [Corynebacteriales bacterium D3-21]